MAERFRGTFDQKVDGKGRMSIPARFRRVLEANDPDFSPTSGPQVMIRYGYDLESYAEAFTVDAINEIDDRIDDMEHGEQRQMMEDIYRSMVLPLEVDSDGRIVIPKWLRDRFGLEGDVTFRARGDHFQIWPAQAVQDRSSDLKDKFLADKGPGYDARALLPPKRSSGDA